MTVCKHCKYVKVKPCTCMHVTFEEAEVSDIRTEEYTVYECVNPYGLKHCEDVSYCSYGEDEEE